MTPLIKEKFEFFFRHPTISPKGGLDNNFSTLYLLRRDVAMCFGFNPNNGTKLEPGYQALWPGVMGIFAGIDLLSKFAEGDSKGKVGERFQNYISRYISRSNAFEIYGLRNSMLHSFGLYNESKNGVQRFVLAGGNFGDQLVTQLSETTIGVDILKLYGLFENSIPAFQAALESGHFSIVLFEEMFEKYGGIQIKRQV
ncbi:hypothetical protein ACQKLP_17770 [Chitinophaga sp. NPDC101104]|uniref:hypothetical protein n=1 Tax=Chitinophaga sp. NPDC101104 TaxID=3390561 RepID=UPI003CFC3DC6